MDNTWRIAEHANTFPNAGAKLLLPYDYVALDMFEFAFINPTVPGDVERDVVQFQFPPVIGSDEKSINWDEKNIHSYEPIAIFMGSDARKISIEAEYVVYADWPPARIFDQIIKFKKHAYMGAPGGGFFGGAGGGEVKNDKAPFVQLAAYLVVPKHGKANGVSVLERSTWRLTSTRITYSGERVCVTRSGDYASQNPLPGLPHVWPVHTTLQIGLSMVTHGMGATNFASGSVHVVDAGYAGGGDKHIVPFNPQQLWY